ncbi:GNAT family N-acetyltransferase [Actinoplanes sp. CA-030573]|uniref:GNAT family N-acetyltransferase n=1 Tax=Actinoplanes sp. CA-030573 TaxID=3239898 RepID=UPI003D8F5E53
MDARIQESVVANLSGRPAPIETGPFVIGVDPGTPSPGINYATPRPGSVITASDVADLVSAFHRAERQPRLEYVTSTAPDLERLLLEAGFTVEERHEYLVCIPETLSIPPAPDGFAIRAAASDEDFAGMVRAQHEGFSGEPQAVAPPADIARMRRLRAKGGIAVVAVTPGGECAGGGQAVPPHDGVSEVAGIAVRPAWRRRGIAAAVTAEVTRLLFAGGAGIAWLEASGPDSWRIYERIGYRPTGKRVYIAKDGAAA